MALQDKIALRLDQLESAMIQQSHLTDPSEVLDLIYSITKFISVMSDEDIDYVQVAMDAVENRRQWNP